MQTGEDESVKGGWGRKSGFGQGRHYV